VPSAPSVSELDAYRDRVDRFIADLDQEYYDHFAGLKVDFDLESVYRNYEDITTLEMAQRVGQAVDGSFRSTELWRFACEGYLGNLTRRYEQDAATMEAKLTATLDGEEIPFRMLRPTMANTEDRGKREQIEAIRNDLTDEHINPILLAQHRTTHAAARDLGAESYKELYIDKFGYRLEDLAEQCRAFLASTEQIFEDAADRLFRMRVGVGLADARRWDVARVFRATEWDPFFPADKMLPALEATLRDLGIDINAQENVHVDVEERPEASIETAVYYVVSEALTNAIKHSHASAISVAVATERPVLRATIADDGVGGAVAGAGSGLTGLSDRVEALGGRFALESPPGRGTRISIELPIATPAGLDLT